MKPTLLIAEDDSDLQDLYEMMLNGAYDITRATNGEQAVALYRERRPDVTVMDIRMPVMNGDVAIEKIRREDPDANIVAITAYDYDPRRLNVPVLRKGFSVAQFRAFIQEAFLRCPPPPEGPAHGRTCVRTRAAQSTVAGSRPSAWSARPPPRPPAAVQIRRTRSPQ